MNWRKLLPSWLSQHGLGQPAPLPAPLWQSTIAARRFLQLPSEQDQRLQSLVAHFLQNKEFSGADGLQVTDAMAVDIAAQACILLLHWGEPSLALQWFDDFVGIVIYPGNMRVKRQSMDEAGVMHFSDQVIMGEAMEGGPVVLSWSAIKPDALPGHGLGVASNVVIHEFAHKIDMRNGPADGCPPLPPGFMGTTCARDAQQLWNTTWSASFERFEDQVAMAERFGAQRPWLDSYAAQDGGEFFAVACEAFFVDRPRFAAEFPELAAQLRALFEPGLA